MAGTLGDMKARIASELVRPDLLTGGQIALAINDAISVYAQERFSFSEVPADGTVTFNTVPQRDTYTAADNPNLGTLLKIDDANINVGVTTNFKLQRRNPEELILYNNVNQQMQGRPDRYAYENGRFILSAIPNAIWLITLAVFMNVDAPATDVEANNPWMTTAEMLIRSRAKFEIATHVTRNATMASAMSPDPPSSPFVNGGVAGATYTAWKRLKGTTNRRTATGIIKPMRF